MSIGLGGFSTNLFGQFLGQFLQPHLERFLLLKAGIRSGFKQALLSVNVLDMLLGRIDCNVKSISNVLIGTSLDAQLPNFTVAEVVLIQCADWAELCPGESTAARVERASGLSPRRLTG